jgi:hypothetical protein
VRRLVGVVAGIAVGLAICSAIASAGGLGQPSSNGDIGSQLMLRLFGETSDSRASFAAAHGDRVSESPLRELALAVHSGSGDSDLSRGSAGAFAEDRVALRDLAASVVSGSILSDQYTGGSSVVHFAAPSGPTALLPESQHYTVAYQPVPPVPAISPAPGTLAFTAPDTRGTDFAPSPAQIGAVKFEEHASGDQQNQPQLALHDATYGAGANFDVRAGKRNLDVNLSSEYEQVGRHDSDSFAVSPLASASSWQLPDGSTPLFVPNYADLNRLSLGAGLSVPVVHGLTLNLNYGAQRLYGGYGLPGLVNLDTMTNTYGGKLVFNIPQISSSLSIGAYQDRFLDSLLPVNGQTQTREDVNFTVKF